MFTRTVLRNSNLKSRLFPGGAALAGLTEFHRTLSATEAGDEKSHQSRRRISAGSSGLPVFIPKETLETKTQLARKYPARPQGQDRAEGERMGMVHGGGTARGCFFACLSLFLSSSIAFYNPNVPVLRNSAAPYAGIRYMSQDTKISSSHAFLSPGMLALLLFVVSRFCPLCQSIGPRKQRKPKMYRSTRLGYSSGCPQTSSAALLVRCLHLHSDVFRPAHLPA